jgi:hypothetical protein
LPRFRDIVVSNLNTLNWPLHVEIRYNDAEVTIIDEPTLKMYYYQGTSWHVCSSTGVDTVNNIVWADLTSAEVLGSPLSIGGNPLSGPTSVGGDVYKVNKMKLLLPWAAVLVMALISACGTAYIIRRRR